MLCFMFYEDQNKRQMALTKDSYLVKEVTDQL